MVFSLKIPVNLTTDNLSRTSNCWIMWHESKLSKFIALRLKKYMSICMCKSIYVFLQVLPSLWTLKRQPRQSSPPWPERYRNTYVSPDNSHATPWILCCHTWPLAYHMTLLHVHSLLATSVRGRSFWVSGKTAKLGAGFWCVSRMWCGNWSVVWSSSYVQEKSHLCVLWRSYLTSVWQRRW